MLVIERRKRGRKEGRKEERKEGRKGVMECREREREREMPDDGSPDPESTETAALQPITGHFIRSCTVLS